MQGLLTFRRSAPIITSTKRRLVCKNTISSLLQTIEIYLFAAIVYTYVYIYLYTSYVRVCVFVSVNVYAPM